MYIGDELGAVVDALVSGSDYTDPGKNSMDIGVPVLPHIPVDNSDRNRTSPFAFTGNKFEFRMPGSSFNIACTNIMLNTAVAEELSQFADELEQADDFDTALLQLIRREIKAHQAIIFNGNGYGPEWPEEASRRGLLNLRATPDALPHYTDEKNVELFARHGVYNRQEMESREEISLEEYNKTLHIEAMTMVHMLHKQILPACMEFSGKLAQNVAVKKSIGVDSPEETQLVRTLTENTASLSALTGTLEELLQKVPEGTQPASRYYCDEILPAMGKAREAADQLEMLVGKEAWPFPTYGDLLFYV